MLRWCRHNRRGEGVAVSFQRCSGPKTCRKTQVNPLKGFALVAIKEDGLVLQKGRQRSRSLFHTRKWSSNELRSSFFHQRKTEGNLRDRRKNRLRQHWCSCFGTCLWVSARITSWRGTSWGFSLFLPSLQLLKFGYQISKLLGTEGATHSRYPARRDRRTVPGTTSGQEGKSSDLKIQTQERSPMANTQKVSPLQNPRRNQGTQDGLQWKGHATSLLTSPAKDSHPHSESLHITLSSKVTRSHSRT